MRVRLFALAGLFAILLASCGGPSMTPASTAVPNSSAPPVPHAPEIRFALVGNIADVNVWALFDAKGYSYNNYALHNEYWPRLYRLSIPDRQFEPMAASAMPSSVQQEGNFYTATVPLRSDLKWTDGNPFTADDVAFTVNTALSFQLGFDWRDFYNPDYLDHAQAVDAHTIKFFFKKQPNVGVWQYGALQGPVVQKAYWSSKVAASIALLPASDLLSQVDALKLKVDDLQKQVNALNTSMATTPMPAADLRQAQANLTRQQGDLDQVANDLAKVQANLDEAMKAARESLYTLNHTNEPTLGNWIPVGQKNGAWINKVNPAHPFGEPHFDSASYQFFLSEDDAVTAFVNRNTDLILEPDGLSQNAIGQISNHSTAFFVKASPTRNLRFVIINQGNSNIADPILYQALACMVNRQNLPNLEGQIVLPDSFTVSDGPFSNHADSIFPCKGLDDASRMAQAVKLLSSAGYSWSRPPSGIVTGQGLKLPNGQTFAPITLLAPKSDSLRILAAVDFQQLVGLLGIPLIAQQVSQDEINYAVFSSHQYDMALLGWRVSEYPGYLCDWFGDGNPFHYDGSRLKSACGALNSTNDLNQAQKQVYEIQSILAQDLPFIPLYSTVIYDAYRNISYPFSNVLGGLSEIYGAPSLAIPASQ